MLIFALRVKRVRDGFSQVPVVAVDDFDMVNRAAKRMVRDFEKGDVQLRRVDATTWRGDLVEVEIIKGAHPVTSGWTQDEWVGARLKE